MMWLPKPGVPSGRVWLAAALLTTVSAIVIAALGAEAAGWRQG